MSEDNSAEFAPTGSFAWVMQKRQEDMERRRANKSQPKQKYEMTGYEDNGRGRGVQHPTGLPAGIRTTGDSRAEGFSISPEKVVINREA